MKNLLALLLLAWGANASAQTVFMGDINPKTSISDFRLPEVLTVTKTIRAHGVVSRANGHIFVPGPSSAVLFPNDLVCYNMEGVRIGPVLAPNLPEPHFDEYMGSLACLVRLDSPKDKRHPYAIMYVGGSVKELPYTDCSPYGFIDGLAVVSDGKEHYLIDHQGNVKATGYEDIGPLTDSRRPVCKKGKWGFMDRDCKVVIEPKYYEVGLFSDQKAWVSKGILSEPILINQFGGELHFASDFAGKIAQAYDFINGEALVVVENDDYQTENKLITSAGLTLLKRDLMGNIWLTDFDNEHAEYFFDAGQDEEGFIKFCSSKGNMVHGLSDFRRGNAFTWHRNKGNLAGHPTARACWVDACAEGDFYTEDHVVWRCNNPEEDLFQFIDEFDGIAMWKYKDETFISSKIRKSEKVEYGGSFPNIIKIVSPDE